MVPALSLHTGRLSSDDGTINIIQEDAAACGFIEPQRRTTVGTQTPQGTIIGRTYLWIEPYLNGKRVIGDTIESRQRGRFHILR